MSYDYASELDPATLRAGNRCGPAALASALLERGWQSDPWLLTLELTHETPGAVGDTLPDGSTSDQLIAACAAHSLPAEKFGFAPTFWDEAVAALAQGRQVLLLLDNWLLRPRAYPLGVNWDALHWVRLVRVLDDRTALLHDPLCWMQGEYQQPYQGPTVATIDSIKAAIIATPWPESGILIGTAAAPVPAPSPVPPTPSPVSPAAELLRQTRLPDGAAQIALMEAWIACEGGLINGTNNPLNVTAPPRAGGGFQTDYWPGTVGIFNSVGVVKFDTLDHGITACALNLKNGPQYAGIRSALQAGNGTAFANEPGLVTWGTGNECLKSTLGV